MNQFWQYWKGYFPPQECDRIIELAKEIPAQPGQIGHGTDTGKIENEVRRSRIRWLPRFDPRFFKLFGNMELLFDEANANAFGFDLTMFREIQFTEYNQEDQGKYDWHHDTRWASEKLHRRKLSMVIQLTDPTTYEGGDFELRESDCNYQVPNAQDIRTQGTVIVFPSFIHHRVTSVMSGVRYSLVCWHEGPYFR